LAGLAAGATFLFLFTRPAGNQFFPSVLPHDHGLAVSGCARPELFINCFICIRLRRSVKSLADAHAPVRRVRFLGFTGAPSRANRSGGSSFRRSIMGVVALMICFWIFRNTPWYPFVS